MENNKRIIIMYDFDKTLSTKYMNEYKLIKDLGYKSNDEFWDYCNNIVTHRFNMESNIAFMYATLHKAIENKIVITKDYLNSVGKKVKFYPGVESWFDRINKYGELQGLEVEHYIISSGIDDIIKGTSIANKFENIFASSYAYDSRGVAFWPRLIVNYTTKTQFIFRIRKNSTFNVYDDKSVNLKITDRTQVVPWTNLIYVGDGYTDIPSMEIVKNKGGNSICIYEDEHKQDADKILQDERVNFTVPADYSANSKIDRVVKNIIDSIANRVE